MTIQKIILDIMDNEGITQIELARKMNISRQAINQMLNSKDMKISTVVLILTYLGYTFRIVKAGEEND